MSLKCDFAAKFPEIVVNDSYWELAVSLQPCFFGIEYGVTDCDDNKIFYLLAHLHQVVEGQALGASDLSQGVLQSKSVGNVSTSYAVTALNAEDELLYGDFKKTIYGRVYLTLLKNSYRRGGVFV